MRNQHEDRTGNHPACAPSDFVHHRAEKRGENHGRERYQRYHQARRLSRQVKSRYEDGGGQFLERDYAAIEEYAEQCGHDELPVGQHLEDIRELEFVLFRAGFPIGGARHCIESCVHCHEYRPEHSAGQKQDKPCESRSCGLRECIDLTRGLCGNQYGGQQEGQRGTESRDSQLETHGECHVPALEPFGY